MSHLDRAHGLASGAKMSSRVNEIWTLAVGRRRVVVMLWDRFRWARRVAGGEMSMPWRLRVGMCGVRREWRRSGMQPVPVQRSRMRRVGGGEERRRREARWVVRVSVSGLGCRVSRG